MLEYIESVHLNAYYRGIFQLMNGDVGFSLAHASTMTTNKAEAGADDLIRQ